MIIAPLDFVILAFLASLGWRAAGGVLWVFRKIFEVMNHMSEVEMRDGKVPRL